MRSKIFAVFLFVLFIFPTFLFATSADVVQELKSGNARYVSGVMSHPHQDMKRRSEIASAQHPRAIIISCSDSRVPPEVVFDQGLGDLFVVRVAGNVLSEMNLGSIEYAVEHLGVSTIVVMGHSRCGAVTAAVQGGKVSGHIKSIVDALTPAVKEAKKEKCESCDLVEVAGHVNVKRIVEKLRSAHHVDVVGAYYDLDSGKVEFLE